MTNKYLMKEGEKDRRKGGGGRKGLEIAMDGKNAHLLLKNNIMIS